MKRSHVETSGDQLISAGSGLDVWEPLVKVTEEGENLLLLLFAESNGVQFRIVLDSRIYPFILEQFWRPRDLNDFIPDAREGICLAVYDDVNTWYTILITLPWKWETSLEVLVRNPTIDDTHAVATLYYDRLAELPLPQPQLDVQTPVPKPDPVM